MMKQYPLTTYWQSIVSGVTTVDYSVALATMNVGT